MLIDKWMMLAWVKALGLDREPFVKMLPTMMLDTESHSFGVDGSVRLDKSPAIPQPGPDIPEFPPWVSACFLTALHLREIIQTNRIHDVVELEARGDWRGFLLLLSRMTDIAASVDTVARLGDHDQQVRYVEDQYRKFVDVLKNTDLAEHIHALQTRRELRMEGRAERAPDALYLAETARGRPLKDHGRGRQ